MFTNWGDGPKQRNDPTHQKLPNARKNVHLINTIKINNYQTISKHFNTHLPGSPEAPSQFLNNFITLQHISKTNNFKQFQTIPNKSEKR